MVYEYEFRLVVHPENPSKMLDLVSQVIARTLPSCHSTPRVRRVIYADPHIRLKNGHLQTKRVERQQAVYHDGIWFRWIESVELPFEQWPMKSHRHWVNACGNHQNSFVVQPRREICLDQKAKVFTFDQGGIVFEWELGEFEGSQNDPPPVASLDPYKPIYELFRNHSYPPSPPICTPCARKPVVPIEAVPDDAAGRSFLVAHKYDGTFCIVYSFTDFLKIKCEGNASYILSSKTLGNGFVFAGEKLRDGTIVLLDVYRVHGAPVSPTCRRAVLTEFLSALPLPEGFESQRYSESVEILGPPPPRRLIDGLVVHDVVNDVVYKVKSLHTLDSLYFDGNFELSDGSKIPCRETKMNMKDGYVYEISLDGAELRRRKDRFTGNTVQQLKRIREAAASMQ